MSDNSVAQYPAGWRLLDDVELSTWPDPQFLIDNLLPEQGLAVLYGQSGACKTTLEASLVVALATGRPFYGHAVARQGPSLYVSADDTAGWKVRVNAAKRAAGIAIDQVVGIYTFPAAVDLRDTGEIDRFIAFVREWHVAFVHICFDTFAACTPGAAENSSEDMTRIIANAKNVCAAFTCNVGIIHHTNASGSRERGHSSLRGDADAMISVTAVDDVIHVECSKLRNGPLFAPIVLKLLPHPEGGCVLRLASDVLPSTDLTPNQSKALVALRDIGGTEGVPAKTWRAACPDIQERTFFKVMAKLELTGRVVKSGKRYRAAGQ